MKRATAFIVIALAVALPRLVSAQPAKFSLDVSPSDGGLDDIYVATVQIEVNGVAGPERYSHPDFDNFKIVDSKTSQTTSMLFDPQRGQELRTIEVRRYMLQPKRTGRLVIGSAKLRLNGKDYETRNAFVTVRAGGGSSALPQSGLDDPGAGSTGLDVPGYRPPRVRPGKDMFLDVVVDQDEVFVGEQATVTWLLYTRADVLGFEPEPPTMDDFWWEKLYEPQRRLRYEEADVGGVPYLVTVVSKRAVFPNKVGQLEIPPFEANVSTMLTPRGRAIELASPPATLRARPLPEKGKPASFDPSYVGVYQVASSVDRQQIAAGESLTLTVTVRGEGAIRRTNPPKVSAEGFRVEGPRDDDPFVDVSGDRVRGERIYRYWLIPEEGGRLTLPSIEVAYFDPSTATYHMARTDPIDVTVSGDPTRKRGDDGAGGLRDNVIGRDIRPMVRADSIDSRVTPYLHRSPWFWGFAGAPPALFALVWLVDRLRERMRKETPRSRLRKARGRARQRFRVAEIHLRGNRPAPFFGELSRVIYEHIEDRLGEPVSSMTRDQMRDFLIGKGFPKPTVERIERELETFDFARFAPSASGPGEMRSALRRVKELLREIERVRPMPGDAEAEEVAA